MPTENVNKADNLIDVGEADQESTEINLDNKGEPEKVEAPKEEKIEVEEVADVPVQEDKREQKAEQKATESINEFIKEGLKYVSKYEYDLPKEYNHRIIINQEIESRVGGADSPFNKGVSFAGVFLKEFYKIKFK